MFTLQVLGTNGLYPTENSPTSGYLVNCNGLRYLVDIGCGIFNKVKEIMPPEDLDGIIVTHYHFDHVSDIGVLSYYLQTKNKRVTVYGPDDGSPYQKLISDSPYFDFVPINCSIERENLKICFYKMNHSVLTYGVSFYCDNKKFSYSSDGNLCDSYCSLLTSCDLAVINCGLLNKDWNNSKPVLSACNVGDLAQKYGVKALISHFNPSISRSELIKEAQSRCESLQPAELKEYLI